MHLDGNVRYGIVQWGDPNTCASPLRIRFGGGSPFCSAARSRWNSASSSIVKTLLRRNGVSASGIGGGCDMSNKNLNARSTKFPPSDFRCLRRTFLKHRSMFPPSLKHRAFQTPTSGNSERLNAEKTFLILKARTTREEGQGE